MDVSTLILVVSTAFLLGAALLSVRRLRARTRPETKAASEEDLSAILGAEAPAAAEDPGVDPFALRSGEIIHAATASGRRYRFRPREDGEGGFDLTVIERDGTARRSCHAQIVHRIMPGKAMTIWLLFPPSGDVAPVVTSPVARVVVVRAGAAAVA